VTEDILIPSIDKRIGSLLEFNRRKELESARNSRTKKTGPTITLSSEYGCETYATAELLQKTLEEKTSQSWLIVDRSLLEEVARNNNLSQDTLKHLGEKNRFMDEMLATFSPSWKNDRDAFSLLSRHIMALAGVGNVIIVGQASAFITQPLKNCYHFRLFASHEFKNNLVKRQLGITRDEAEKLIARKQKERDHFVAEFTGCDPYDRSAYNLLFNNDRISPEKMAKTIVKYVLDT